MWTFFGAPHTEEEAVEAVAGPSSAPPAGRPVQKNLETADLD